MSGWRATISFAFLTASTLPVTAQMNCQTAITEFRDIVNTETSMGHVSGSRQTSAMTELSRIEQTCRSGRNAEALAALRALQRRMGFR